MFTYIASYKGRKVLVEASTTSFCFLLEHIVMSVNKISKINPVQKHMHKFNKPKVFKNKKTDYSRKEKHPGYNVQDPSFA